MSLRRNIIANYVGQGWTGLMAIAFIPVYIKYLGVEAYGLVGIFALLQSAMSLLDVGMTPTFNREMARYGAGARTAASTLDLLRSLEVIYLLLGALVVLGVWIGAPWLATHWLIAQRIPPDQVVQSLVVMSIVVALRAWESIYRGAIQGLQKQVWLNVVQAAAATLRWGGAIAVLAWVSPTIDAYFLWQGLVSLLTVFAYAAQTYRWLPRISRRVRFSFTALHGVARFSGGIALSAILSLALTQSDKIILSKLFSLETFGYYTLAATVANSLWLFVYPMSYALYPRLSEHVARNEPLHVARTYMAASQWLSALIVPPALVLAAFAKTVILIWTGDPVLTLQVAPLVRLLILGNLFNGLINPANNLQLAYGWPGLALKANFVALCVLLPAMIIFVPIYGSLGAASVWFVLNLCMMLTVYVMHRRLLPGRKWEWYRTVVVVPLLVGGLLAGGLAWSVPLLTDKVQASLLLAGCGFVIAAGVGLSLPAPRKLFLSYFQTRTSPSG